MGRARGASHLLSSLLPCADSARVRPPERRSFRVGERDRLGRTVRRPAEWLGPGSGLPTPASDRDHKISDSGSATVSVASAGVACVQTGRDIAPRCPRRAQRRSHFECQCRSDIRSARCYAGGDGAARHPYHRARYILDSSPTGSDCCIVHPWVNSFRTTLMFCVRTEP